MLRGLDGAPLVARYTWRRHWRAASCIGLAVGIINLAPFVFKRSLGASRRDVALLISLWQIPWILAPAVGPWMERLHPQRVWRGLALVGALPLVGIALVRLPSGDDAGTVWLFPAFLAVHYLASVVYIPHLGALMRTNYDATVRSRIYGVVLFVSILATAGMAQVAGALLDADPRHLRWLFPLAGVLAVAGMLIYARIRWRGYRRERAGRAAFLGWRAEWRSAWGRAFGILRNDRLFRDYEFAFMLYGVGFLMSFPLLVDYAEAELGLSYQEFAVATGIAFPAMQILTTPFWGALSHRLGMVRTTAVCFLVLAGFFALLPLVRSREAFWAAYLLFGTAMAGVSVSWSLGPLHFAPPGGGRMYAAVHFSMVGVRSAFAPFLGYAVAAWLGIANAFLLAAGVVVLGAGMCLYVARRERLAAA